MQNNVIISNNIQQKLIGYQTDHVRNLITILKNNNAVLDASDTGTGKTYTAAATIATLKLTPIIICPKSVINVWLKVCKIFNVKPFFVVNYESIKNGKYYVGGVRTLCPYLDIKKDTNKTDNTEIKLSYEWNVKNEPNICFVFDEVHKCHDRHTQNGKLLRYAKDTEKPLIMLSATIADYPEKFKFFFYLLNFIDPVSVKENKIDYSEYMKIMLKWIYRDPKPMVRIHNMLYPERASRMRVTELGDLFPQTQITAESYTVSKKREVLIEKHYNIIAKELDKLQSKEVKDKRNILTKILRLQQRIELLKVSTFVELANDYLYNGFSVVIFVNFTQTLKLLASMLNTKSLIYGEQTGQEREKNIENFQINKTKIIICNIKAGGIGISLHDIHGGHPRVSLISPTWSSIDLTQALGRINRAGGKTKSLQRIVYIANTVEDKIADKLRDKLNNLNSINNGDLDLTHIIFKATVNKL